MLNTKKPTRYLGCQHRLNLMVSCAKSFMGKTFERVDCLHVQIIWAKCSKYKESVSLKNTDHLATSVAHIDTKKIQVMLNVSDERFRS